MTTKTITSGRVAAGWLLPAGLMLGSFIVLLDATIVSLALPSIGTHLHAATSGLQWVYDAYTLCLSALLLSGGALGDRYGRKRVYLTGVAGFTAASLGCALAPDAGTLIGLRAVQGCAGALVATGVLSLLVQTYQDPKKRAEMIGISGMVAGLAVVLGPVLGGVLVEAAGWRAIFLVNLPVGAVTVWLGARWLTDSSDPGHAAADPAGQVVGLVLLGSLTYGLIGSETRGWHAPATVVPLVVAVLAVPVFILVERRVARPLLPLPVFASAAFTVPNLASFVLAFSTSTVFFLLSLFLQQVQRLSPMMTGLQFLPLTVAIGLVSPLAGKLAGRHGPYRVMAGGYAICGAALAGLWLLGPHSTHLFISVFGVVLGIGMGASISPTQIAGVLGLPPQRSGLASACINTTRQAGTTLGVAVLGLIVASSAGTIGAPGYGSGFSNGLHIAGTIAAAATVAAAALAALMPRRQRRRDR